MHSRMSQHFDSKLFSVSGFHRFGRRLVILISLSLLAVFGVAIAFTPNIYAFIAMKFILGGSCGVTVMNLSVLGDLVCSRQQKLCERHILLTLLPCSRTGVEWTDPSKSALITITIILFFSFGLMILSGVAYLIPQWRVLILVLLSPLVLLVGFMYWSAIPSNPKYFRYNSACNCGNEVFPTLGFYRYVPESARWLLTQGRKEEARKLLQRAARTNKKLLPEDALDKVTQAAIPTQSLVIACELLLFLIPLAKSEHGEEAEPGGHLPDPLPEKTCCHHGI